MKHIVAVCLNDSKAAPIELQYGLHMPIPLLLTEAQQLVDDLQTLIGVIENKIEREQK
jgi:hypothetical protein